MEIPIIISGVLKFWQPAFSGAKNETSTVSNTNRISRGCAACFAWILLIRQQKKRYQQIMLYTWRFKPTTSEPNHQQLVICLDSYNWSTEKKIYIQILLSQKIPWPFEVLKSHCFFGKRPPFFNKKTFPNLICFSSKPQAGQEGISSLGLKPWGEGSSFSAAEKNLSYCFWDPLKERFRKKIKYVIFESCQLSVRKVIRFWGAKTRTATKINREFLPGSDMTWTTLPWHHLTMTFKSCIGKPPWLPLKINRAWGFQGENLRCFDWEWFKLIFRRWHRKKDNKN